MADKDNKNVFSGSPNEYFNPLDDDPFLQIGSEEEYLDSGESADQDSLPSLEPSSFDRYAVTPPTNSRAVQRGKEKSRSTKIKQIQLEKERLKMIRAQRKNSNKGMNTEGLGDVICSIDPLSTSPNVFDPSSSMTTEMMGATKKKKDNSKPFKTARSIDRDMKMSSGDLTSLDLSLPAQLPLKVDMPNRFQSLRSKLVPSGPVNDSNTDHTYLQRRVTSYSSLECPQDRIEFYKTFSILVNLGNSMDKKKKEDTPYVRQMSSEQEYWQSQLSDLLWLEVQGWFHQRTMEQQDGYLMKARDIVPSVLEEVMYFKVHLKTPEGEPPKMALHTIEEDSLQSESISIPRQNSCNSDERIYLDDLNSPKLNPPSAGTSSFETLNEKADMLLNEIIANQKEALFQVTDLLEKLEKVEKLYPTLKALGNDYSMYSSETFQNKLNTLCLWSNITKDIGNKLSLMATVLYVDNIPGLEWPWLDYESPSQSYDNPNTITPTIGRKGDDGLSSEDEEGNDAIFTSDLSGQTMQPQSTNQSYNDGLSSSSDDNDSNDGIENAHSSPISNVRESFNDGLSSSDDNESNDVESGKTMQSFNDGLSSSSDDNATNEGAKIKGNVESNSAKQSFNDGLSSSSDDSETDEGTMLTSNTEGNSAKQSFSDSSRSVSGENNDSERMHNCRSCADSEQVEVNVVVSSSLESDTTNSDTTTPKCNKNVRFFGLDLNSPDTSPVDSAVNLLACSPTESSTPKKIQHFTSRQISNTSTLSRTSSSMSYEEFRTSIYRHFVDRHLKKMGLRKLLHRLKCLLDGSLQRARHALEKPKEMVKSESMDIVNTERLSPESEVLSTSPSLDGIPASEDIVGPERRESLISYGCYSTEFQHMNLPSFKATYLFLVRIPLDVVHECLRLRLEQRPETDPSLLSVKQLIRECKEVLMGAVMVKQYYLSMVNSSVLEEHDKNDVDMGLFEEDLRHMLEVYFDYVQTWMSGLQRTYEMSKKLKNFLEDEWKFVKNVCPHVIGGEANAGRRFCLMASSLLRSISDFLEFGMDECVNQLYDSTLMESDQENQNQAKRHSRGNEIRHAIIHSCRGFKETFHEARERASKALGFAKMLRKDLEIAADFNIQVTAVELLAKLNETNHVRVITSYSSGYLIFVPHQIKHDKKQILQLLNITCGREDPSNHPASEHQDGYLLLLKCESCLDHQKDCPMWHGPKIKVEPNADTTIALSHIEVESLLLVVVHSSQLSMMRREFERLMESCVVMVAEQTSCHRAIAESLSELRTASMELREHVSDAIRQVEEKLSVEDMGDLEEGEKVSIQKLYRETLHQCYSFGFEYHRELVRLVSGDMREALSRNLVMFAKQWMTFVRDKCERGRGVKPRWAKPGLDFLIVACEPRITRFISKSEFSELKSTIHICIMHLIGDKPPHHTSPGSRVGSPLPDSRKQMMNRNMSCPDGARTPTRSISNRSVVSDPATPSDRTEFLFPDKHQVGILRKNSMPPLLMGKGDTDVELNEGDDGGIVFDVHPHLVLDPLLENVSESSKLKKIRTAIQDLEQKRTNVLYKKKQIGRMTLQQREVDYHITNKKVNFKWQRGIKIGEGRFGKVYTAVNMDSGVLMAMKEIRFQPNDYQTIKDIADEIKIFETLSHPSLVKYYGVEVHREEMLIFMEFCAEGTVEEVARQGLPEVLLRLYTSQILTAIHHLHEMSIVHRDIKGANIFLTANGPVKLGDFGCAVKLKSHTTMPGEVNSLVGTTAFMAPEVIQNNREGSGRASDIWSLGCVVVEMATGKRPWHDLANNFAIMYKVGTGGCPPIPSSLSEEGKDFLSHCLVQDPSQRWTASQLHNHPFVKVSTEDDEK